MYLPSLKVGHFHPTEGGTLSPTADNARALGKLDLAAEHSHVVSLLPVLPADIDVGALNTAVRPPLNQPDAR